MDCSGAILHYSVYKRWMLSARGSSTGGDLLQQVQNNSREFCQFHSTVYCLTFSLILLLRSKHCRSFDVVQELSCDDVVGIV